MVGCYSDSDAWLQVRSALCEIVRLVTIQEVALTLRTTTVSMNFTALYSYVGDVINRLTTP